MKKHLPGLVLISLFTLLLIGATLSGCDNAALTGENGAVVSGSVSLPASVSGKTWAVYVDTDYEVGNGFTKAAGGSVTGTGFSYSMTGVPAGTFYVYTVVYMGSAVTGDPTPGDYVAMYGASSVDSLPETANCPIPASGTATYDMTAMLMPDMGGDGGDDVDIPANALPFTDDFAADSYLSTHAEVLAGEPVAARTSSISGGYLNLDATAWENVSVGPYPGSYRCTLFFPLQSVPDKTKVTVDFKANPNLAVGLSDASDLDDVKAIFADVTGTTLRFGTADVYSDVDESVLAFTPDADTLYRLELYVSRSEAVMAYQLKAVGSDTVLLSDTADIPENYVSSGGLYLQTYRYREENGTITPAQARAQVDSVSVEAFTGSVPGTDAGSGVAITGTISLPASVSATNYIVIVDDDYDGGNGYAGSGPGLANGTSIDYSVEGITPGSYYIYAIVYASGSAGGPPSAGDFFGAYGAGSIADWPNNTPKVAIAVGGANVFDFTAFTAPDMGGGSGSGVDQALYEELGEALFALERAYSGETPVINASNDATWTFSSVYDATSGYTLTGSITQLSGQTTVSGTVNFTGGAVSRIILEGVTASDGTGGTYYVTFVDDGEYTYIDQVLTPAN